MILGNSSIGEEYYDVFYDSRVGIDELLDIPMFAHMNIDASDFLLYKTLTRINIEAGKQGFNRLSEGQFRGLCDNVYDRYY